jgi:hypothetical protein
MKWLLIVPAVLAFTTVAGAEDKKPEDKKAPGPVALSLKAKTDKYKFDGGGKTPAEYKKELEELAAKAKKGELVRPPKPPAVDFVLVLTNTTKEDVTVYVGGDPNIFTFDLTGGDGVVTMNSGLAFTADFKLPKAITITPGKAYEIPVKQLSDGSRGMSRYVYWTGPGDYKISAKYTLSDKDGGRVAELKSEPIKITVEK